MKPPDQTTTFELRLGMTLATRIERELREGPRDKYESERAGFLLCGVGQLDDRVVLLARRWKPVPTHRRVHLRGYGLAWEAAFNAEVLDEAEGTDTVPILLHRHEAGWPIGLSVRDRQSGDPLLAMMSRSIPGRLAGSVVLNDDQAAGLLWSNGAVMGVLSEVRVAGFPITRRGHLPNKDQATKDRLEGQTLAIGPASEGRLRSTAIAVIGLSGGGSHVVQQVAHQGFGTIILIDDDVVDPRSRGRLVGSIQEDDGHLKTATMRRLIQGIEPTITVVEVPCRTNTAEGIAGLRQADIAVACVDRFSARAQINDLCRRFLIPLIDVGMTITSDGEHLLRATGQVVLSLPGGACLRCTPIASDAILAKEQQDRPAGYDRNLDAPGDPQVVSMNGLLSSHASTLALAIATGYLPGEEFTEGGWWQYDALGGQLDFTSLSERRPSCPGCGEEGHGDPRPY